MHSKCFHALNCTEEVIKMSISYLKSPERKSRQQATETAAVLPWFPSFNFQGAAGAMSTQQRPHGITSSHSGQLLLWGGNSNYVGCATVPQEPLCNTEASFFQGSSVREPTDTLWEVKARATDPGEATEKQTPTQRALPAIYWIGQFPFQIVSIFWKKPSFHVRQEPAFSKMPASLMSPKCWYFDDRDIIP